MLEWQNNDRYIKNLSDTALTDHDKTLLSKGLKFIPTPPKPDSHRSLIKDFNNFTRNMRLKFSSLIVIANHTRSMSNLTGNRHHNLQWHLKTTWNKQNMRLLRYRFAIRRTTYQQKNEKPLQSFAQTRR